MHVTRLDFGNNKLLLRFYLELDITDRSQDFDFQSNVIDGMYNIFYNIKCFNMWQTGTQ